jgi:adenylate kinase
MDTRTIFFVGKPGCGKGTQAKLLAEKTGWPVMGSGDQFRAIAAEDTPVGHKVKKEMEEGLLMPHWFAMYIYLRAIFGVPADKSAIFDGFNRKVPEAELIVSSLNWLGRPFTVVHVKVSDEEVLKRLAGRKAVSGRADDHFVEERIREYKEYTEAAIDIFRKAGALVEVNGEQSPEAIAADISAALDIK